MTFDHRRTTHHLVRGIGSICMEMGRVNRFVDHWFTSQRRFIDLQRNSLLQNTVSRDLFSAFEQYNISDHNILLGYLCNCTLANHFDRCIIVGTVQQVEFAHGIVLEPKGNSCSQKNGTENTDCFGKFIVDKPNTQRQKSCYEQDPNHRIRKFFKEKHPQRFSFGWGQDITAMTFATLLNLSLRKAFQLL